MIVYDKDGNAMPAGELQPTPYPDVNALLRELIAKVQTILGDHIVGMYLDGSLTGDGFDQDSDIDFVVVSDEDVSADQFVALQAMHDRIATLDTPWAIQLEGSYIGQRALRRYDPAHALHPNIERGPGERLKMVQHDAGWIIHCYIVRERGITLLGPPPQTLIDPVSPIDLRRAMLSVLSGWATRMLDTPKQLKTRGYQSYVVLSLCRILYTLQHGAVVSKPGAARWVQQSMHQRWAPLIEQAWEGRHNPDLPAPAEDVDATLAMIRYTLEQGRQFESDLAHDSAP
jgi:predicted nucleotidyltransferase